LPNGTPCASIRFSWAPSAGFSPLFPFSVFELLVYALVLLAPWVLIRFFILLLSAPRGLGAWAERLLRRAVCLLSALLLLFTLGAGVNYSRASFASLSGLDVEPSSTEELLQLCLLLARDAAAEAENVPSENGVLTLNGFPVRAAPRRRGKPWGIPIPFSPAGPRRQSRSSPRWG
jgi:hypothetical protein